MTYRIKLSTKLILVFLLAGLLPMIGTGLYNYINTQGTLRKRIFNENGVYVEQKALMVNEWMDQRISEFSTLLTIPMLYESAFAMSTLKPDMGDAIFAIKYMNVERMMAGFIKEKGYSNAALALVDGTVIFDSTKGERSAEGKSIADRDYFKKALQGQVTLSKFFHSPILHEPVLVIAGPVRRQGIQGEVVGVLLVVMPTKAISEKILSGVERLGESGDTYLVDSSGTLLTSSRRFPQSEVLKLRLNTKPVEILVQEGLKAGKGEFSGFTSYKDQLGRPILASFSVLKLGDELYGLVAEQDETEALAELVRMKNVTLLSAAIAAIFVSLCGFFVGKSLAKPLRKVAGGLSEAAQHTASASMQVSSTSQQLAEGASEQAASLEETSSSLEEMASMTRQNAENVHQANNLMNETARVVAEAKDAMDGLTRAMTEISKASEQTAKIIRTIDEIAFQTNLLALNAAVEAARAGEAGAGFAVVADEVRNLAQRAAEAARNTASLIEETLKKVKDGSSMVGITSDAFERVAQGTAKIGELLGEIAAASQEQALGIEQINVAVAQMDKAVQKNAANAEQSAAAAQELQAQAQLLRRLVEELLTLVEGSCGSQENDQAPKAVALSKAFVKQQRAGQPEKGNGGQRPKRSTQQASILDEDDRDFGEFTTRT